MQFQNVTRSLALLFQAVHILVDLCRHQLSGYNVALWPAHKGAEKPIHGKNNLLYKNLLYKFINQQLQVFRTIDNDTYSMFQTERNMSSFLPYFSFLLTKTGCILIVTFKIIISTLGKFKMKEPADDIDDHLELLEIGDIMQ